MVKALSSWVKRFNKEGVAGLEDRLRAQADPQPGSAECADQLSPPEPPILGISL